MNKRFSLHDLAAVVNEWCETHGIVPANGQAGECITERNIRFYRTMGLLDAPRAGAGAGYDDKHRLQLVAIRLLQAQGLPLRRIRDLLLGRSEAELRDIQQRGLAERRSASAPLPWFPTDPRGETWSVLPLNADFLLVTRTARPIAPDLADALRATLEHHTHA